MLVLVSPVWAVQPLDVDQPWQAVGGHALMLEETDGPLDLVGARDAWRAGLFHPARGAVLNLGIGARPHWLRFELNNRHETAVLRSFLIENSWLDRLDLYLVHNGRLVDERRFGDRLPSSVKPVSHRHPVYEPLIPPGPSELYVRVATPDPMVVPVLFGQPADRVLHDTINHYTYGALYGFGLALLAYNLVLYLRVRHGRYLMYGLFLLSFILMNMTYTGHLAWFFWPEDRPVWQWLNPLTIAGYGTFGILFGLWFLDTRHLAPRIHQAILIAMLAVWAGLVVMWALDLQSLGVATAIGFAILYSLIVLPLAVIAWAWGRSEAIYYLLGTLAGAYGTAVTALAVTNVISFNVFTFRMVEIGVSVDAVLLSFALAEQFRVAHRRRESAEQVSRLDPLTSLYNRRAFQALIAPLLANAERERHPVAVLILDIDHFKKVNDRFGHHAGDEVLRQVADVMRRTVRRADVLARWGGEEFIVLMPNADKRRAQQLAERLRAGIQRLPSRRSPGRSPHRITASLGVASHARSIFSLDALLRDADTNLYRAKEMGRNCVCA